ncbi:MAG: mRNA-binding ribosome synthesis protein nop7 [Bathelium mastoideum]|nr:MAG: mRNA-binding ribosome synthesis protein nop7 [Bathelium mastoideum]
MARIKKKGTSGQAKNFITRTQAVRKLQISLPDFRRLCIFKGIYPREPRNKKKASKSSTPSTTFYYTKDIQYLLHEPLLRKFRDHKALAKKIAKALGRGEVGDAARLERNLTPRITLDHIIKERYPTFIDALRDLDDALSMLFLFANLPSSSAVPPKTITLCQRLCLEFEHYLIVSHSLRKSFLSIKGIYYQATVQGQDVLWLVPYKFVQRTSGDIDFRIMGTFVEFYTTLLGFVNFRLYTSIGLIYPPKFNANADDRGGELGAFTLEGRGFGEVEQPTEMVNGTNESSANVENSAAAQAEADRLAALNPPQNGSNTPTRETSLQPSATEVSVSTAAIDTFEPIAEDADTLPQPQVSSNEAASLFAPFTFHLSRETPRQPLEFLLKAFGCKRVGWDPVLGDGTFTTSESDAGITHQIVDRPPLPASALPPERAADGASNGTNGEVDTDTAQSKPGPNSGQRYPNRTYIQPQWVWDCVNAGKLLRPDLYAPGATLPPHLSPWVKPKQGQYDPTQSLAEQEMEGEAEIAEAEAEERAIEDAQEEDEDEMHAADDDVDFLGGEEGNPLLDLDDEVEAGEGMDVAASEDDDEEVQSPPALALAAADSSPEEDNDWTGIDSDQDPASSLHQRELEAEAAGLPPPSAESIGQDRTGKKSEELRRKQMRRRREEEEELERRKTMMTRRKRKTLERMMYGNARRDAEAEKLRAKRRKIERTEGGG